MSRLIYIFILSFVLTACESLEWLGVNENKVSLTGIREKLFDSEIIHSKMSDHRDSLNKIANIELIEYSIPKLLTNKSLGNSTPIITHNQLHFLDSNYNLIGYDFVTKTYLYQQALSSKRSNYSSHYYINDYSFTTLDEQIYFYHQDKLLWQTKLTLPTKLSPAIGDNYLCYLNIKSDLECFDIHTGQKLAVINNEFNEMVIDNYASPQIIGHSILSPTVSGYLTNYDLENAQINWQLNLAYKFDNPISGRFTNINLTPQIIDNDTVLVNNYGGGLFAINGINGQIKWQQNIPTIKNLSYNSKLVMAIDHNNQLFGVSLMNGDILWKHKLDNIKNPDIVMADKVALITAKNNKVTLYDTSTGSKLDTIKLSFDPKFKPQYRDGSFVVIGANKLAIITIKN